MAATISTLSQKGFIILQQHEHETLGVSLAHLEGTINFKNVAKQTKLVSAGAAREAFKAIMAKLMVELDVVGNHVGSAASFEEAAVAPAPAPLPEQQPAAGYSRHSPVPPPVASSSAATATTTKKAATKKSPAAKKPTASSSSSSTTSTTSSKKRRYGDTEERAPAPKWAKALAPARKLSAMRKGAK